MKRFALLGLALASGIALIAAAHVRAQSPAITAPGTGTVYIEARDAPRNVTVSRQDTVLTFMQFPKDTILSVVDEHLHPVRRADGALEFHGDVELRAMVPADRPQQLKDGGRMAGFELMRHAPMVIAAQGVDVLVETASAK
jgi:hypothetical protein